MDFLELQKKFNLFALNDVVKGTVASADSEKLNIKLAGGAMAAMNYALYQEYEGKGIKLKAGKGIEGVVVNIIDGIPYLVLSENFVLTGKPQKGFIKFSGPHGIVVSFEFDEKIIGYYQSADTLDILAENTPVMCDDLKKAEDYYTIGKIELCLPPVFKPEKTAPKKNSKLRPIQEVFKMPEDWSDEYIKKHFTDSQCRESKEEFRLGRCYIASPHSMPNLAILRDDIKAQIVERHGYDPKPGEKMLIRITKITAFGQMEAEILDVPSKEYIAWFYEQRDKEGVSEAAKIDRIKNGFNFSQKDNKLFAIAMKNGSECKFQQYWLGFLHEVRIKNGVPFYENRAVPFIKVKLIDSDVEFSENDIVYCRLHFIEKKDDQVIFTAKVEYAEHADFV